MNQEEEQQILHNVRTAFKQALPSTVTDKFSIDLKYLSIDPDNYPSLLLSFKIPDTEIDLRGHADMDDSEDYIVHEIIKFKLYTKSFNVYEFGNWTDGWELNDDVEFNYEMINDVIAAMHTFVDIIHQQLLS